LAEYLVKKEQRADDNIHIIVDFESFSKVLNRPGGFRDPGEPEEYCRGFQVFDKDMTGFIGVGQLRYSKSLIYP
jgi:Ca2+-binding EF-hand superfamily protein